MRNRPLAIAVVSAGAMGAQLGATLVAHGARVMTCVHGRSSTTRERAVLARMELVDLQELGSADMLLAIAPSDQAIAIAEALLEVGALRARGPLYVECNPLSAQTLGELSARLARAGCSFVDACILGGPSPGQTPAMRLCVSGARAAEVGALASYGLSVRVLPGPLGTSSALRLGISGVSKGLVALLALTIARAHAVGVAELLREELARSHEGLLQWVSRQSARLPAEAGRWAAELREVAASRDKCAALRVLSEMAEYFARLDTSPPEMSALRGALEAFFGASTAGADEARATR